MPQHLIMQLDILQYVIIQKHWVNSPCPNNVKYFDAYDVQRPVLALLRGLVAPLVMEAEALLRMLLPEVDILVPILALLRHAPALL